jgi:hypothetical protein
LRSVNFHIFVSKPPHGNLIGEEKDAPVQQADPFADLEPISEDGGQVLASEQRTLIPEKYLVSGHT